MIVITLKEIVKQKKWSVIAISYSQSIFIDTTAFLALINKSDENYLSAVKFIQTWEKKLPKYKNLITSDYIVSETISKVRFWIGNIEAIELGNNLLDSRLVEIIYTTKENFDRAWEIFQLIEEFNIKRGFTKTPSTLQLEKEEDFPTISYTDSVTLACIDQYSIPALFAFDPDLVYLAKQGILKKEDFLKNRDLEVYP